nr:MAG TPA: hypothetical protein [Caudoviricetes sp.]
MKILNAGKLIITPNHAYIGPNKIDLTKDTNTTYGLATSTTAGLLSPELYEKLNALSYNYVEIVPVTSIYENKQITMPAASSDHISLLAFPNTFTLLAYKLVKISISFSYKFSSGDDRCKASGGIQLSESNPTIWNDNTLGYTYTVSNVLYLKHDEKNQIYLSIDSETGPWTLTSISPTNLRLTVLVSNRTYSTVFNYTLNGGSYEIRGVE